MESSAKNQMNSHRLMELAVPVFSFGGAAVAILFEMQGISLDFHYPAFGCVIASVILAYLAWLRPKKDIVSLATPICAAIFFIVPNDFSTGILLQLLYAVSLTALLIRLKYRFGSSPPLPGQTDIPGPLEAYVAEVTRLLPQVSPQVAGDAGRVFIRFAHGEFEAAARLATARSQELSGDGEEPIAAAFAIVAEQAAHTSTGIAVPAEFRQFLPGQHALRFHPERDSTDREQEYSTALDNALLLLYAVALIHAEGDQKLDVISCRKFAQKVAVPV
jgi:hypothetical protein